MASPYAKGRPKGSHDIAPKIRGAFKRALLMLEEEGKPLSELIKEEILKDPLAAIRTIGAFVPKEMLLCAAEGDELHEILQSIMNETPPLKHESGSSTF